VLIGGVECNEVKVIGTKIPSCVDIVNAQRECCGSWRMLGNGARFVPARRC
jgi:hypothetical protein